MPGKMNVDPAELRSAAHAEDAIADDMKGQNSKALSDNQAAAESLEGWPIAAALHSIGETWRPSLDGMHERAKAGAANLRASADGHEWNDDLVSRDFEKAPSAAMAAMSTPAGTDVTGAVGLIRLPSSNNRTLPDPGFASPTPVFTPGGEYQPPAPGSKALSTDDMLNAKPAMPVYESEAGTGAAHHPNKPSPDHSDSPFG
ncbi:type VII secretion target [Streptomyces noursei]|uniref:type VII secretion target n=1 Tax=Streptomyces noursei TaxID=1971 RepID=UPI00099D9962|nr:type VII secretion target [Streptomyces noursei]